MADADPMIFVTRKWPPAMGGMETYCFKLVQQLRKRREVELLALPGRADGSVPDAAQLLSFGMRVGARLLFGRPLPDLIHVGDMAAWPFAALARLRRPSVRVVMSAHGTDVSYGRRAGFRGWLYRHYLRAGGVFVPSACIIANSGATAEACREAGYRHVDVVALASDLRPPAAGPLPGRNMLFAGRLIRRKGLSRFVQNVLPLLPAGIGLDVAGSRWSDDEAKSLSNARVNYLGVLDPQALANAYAGALCVVVPNIDMPNGEFEGFGLVAVEAAASGGVVVASGTGGLRSAVIDGVTGFLVEPGDRKAWAARIEDIGRWPQSQRDGFVAASVERAQAHFSWDRVAQETEAIYAATVKDGEGGESR